MEWLLDELKRHGMYVTLEVNTSNREMFYLNFLPEKNHLYFLKGFFNGQSLVIEIGIGLKKYRRDLGDWKLFTDYHFNRIKEEYDKVFELIEDLDI